MNITVYGNGSSRNHGCEAIVRGTVALLTNEPYSFVLQSENAADDIRYGLNELLSVFPAKSEKKRDLRFLKAYAVMRLTRSYTEMDGLNFLLSIESAAKISSIALSVGGDNYCYSGTEIYPWLNREYHRHGMKTILWGCSVEPTIIQKKGLQKDFGLYNAIVARESITYDAMRQVSERVVLAPDPAFFMPAAPCQLDPRFENGHVIGINASPMIISNEAVTGAAYDNYKHLITWILNNTDRSVALIPHVVWSSNDDRTVLNRLFDDINDQERLILVEDHNAPELKYIISRCEFFIGARTHATIAAYSSSVPTLVVGYSVKARGIARDLFDNETGYVLPVQQLATPDDLTNAFIPLYESRDSIRNHYSVRLPEYLKTGVGAVDMLKKVVETK